MVANISPIHPWRRHALGFITGAAVALLFSAFNAAAQNLYVLGNNGAESLCNVTAITPGGTQTTIASGLTNASALAVDNAGNLFVQNGASPYVITEIKGGGAQTNFFSASVPIYSMAFNSAGNLFVSAGANVFELTPGGGQSTFIASAGLVEAMGFNSAGYLIALQNVGTNGELVEYASNGVEVSTLNLGVQLYSLQPWTGRLDGGLAINGAGDVFVAGGDGSIFEVNPQTGISPFASGLSGAAGMAFDSAGNLLVANYSGNNIIRISTNGTKTVYASGVFFGPGLQDPIALAFGPVPSIQGVSISVQTNTAVVRWPAVAGISSYRVDYATNLSGAINWEALGSTTNNSMLDTNALGPAAPARFYRVVGQEGN
jgi:hypothetical protein